MTNRFLRKYRLLTAKEYQYVFQKGYRFTNQQLTLIVKPNELDYSRLGLVVAKKQIAKANKRNTIKRLIRESFRCKQTALQGLDIIVMVYKPSLVLENAGLTKCLEHQWQKLQTRYKNA